jgi:histidinol dehydrogenase
MRSTERRAMPQFLATADPDFPARFDTFLGTKREADSDVDAAVAAIIADVALRGDAAVIELTTRFDRLALTPETLAFTEADIDAAVAQVPAEERTALELAATRIRNFHERQLPADAQWMDASGAQLGWRWTPVDAAGLYVPGGLASYPSSVLMNAIPARVAGVGRLVICAPTPDGVANPLVLLAAARGRRDRLPHRRRAGDRGAGLRDRDHRAGGQDHRPGNAWVAAAKRRVFGRVGIDMIAGPSEVLVIADADNDPEWIALDLMSQAEHDAAAQAILITDDADFGAAVAGGRAPADRLERREIAGRAGAISGRSSPCATGTRRWRSATGSRPSIWRSARRTPRALAARVRHAGAIFIGALTPEAIGDYVGGPNHVLPTARSARFSSGLSVLDFMKRTTIARMTPAALAAIGPAAETLARSEGLEAHGLSVRARLDRINEG